MFLNSVLMCTYFIEINAVLSSDQKAPWEAVSIHQFLLTKRSTRLSWTIKIWIAIMNGSVRTWFAFVYVFVQLTAV
jgi:hypothetical protein